MPLAVAEMAVGHHGQGRGWGPCRLGVVRGDSREEPADVSHASASGEQMEDTSDIGYHF